MKNFESFSVLCWANRAKADVNGLLPVYARVTVMGKRAEISLKKKVSPDKWDAKSGFMTGNSNDTRLFNKHLISVNNDLHAAKFPKSTFKSCQIRAHKRCLST